MTKMTLPMREIPAVISQSVSDALRAHGLAISPELLREVGNNATQALFSIDESLMEEAEPSMADRIAVGETLRSLAMLGRPNLETARALERVGEWLLQTARPGRAKAKPCVVCKAGKAA